MSHTHSSKIENIRHSARNHGLTGENSYRGSLQDDQRLDRDRHADSRENKKHSFNPLTRSAATLGNKQNTGSSYLSSMEQDCLRTIISNNAKYYQDKTKVCCSNKPTKHRLMLPSHTGNSTYKLDFIPKEGIDSSTGKRFAEYKSKTPFMNTTNYNDSFIPHKITPRKRESKDFQPINDAPRFLQTQYKGDFRAWEPRTDNIKVEYPENIILGVGEMAKKSVYGSEFLGRDGSRLDNCKFPDSTLFADWHVPKTSNYKQEYTKKNHYSNSNYKMKNTYLPTVGLPNYNSEYKGQFEPKKKRHCSYKKIYTVDELQDLILSV